MSNVLERAFNLNNQLKLSYVILSINFFMVVKALSPVTINDHDLDFEAHFLPFEYFGLLCLINFLFLNRFSSVKNHFKGEKKI